MIDEGVLRWFGHIERMKNGRTAKRICLGECNGSRSVGRTQKRWIDTVKDCLGESLDVKEASRMVHNRSE